MRTGRASVESLGDSVEFPRIDPRRIGSAAGFVASAANWRNDSPRRGALFHGVQVRDLQTGRADRFDYGERMVVEEHIVVPRPGASGERDAWLVGTSFDATRHVTLVNVLDAAASVTGRSPTRHCPTGCRSASTATSPQRERDP